MLSHQASDLDSFQRQRTTASMPGTRDFSCSSAGRLPSVKSVSFPLDLDSREQNRTFRTRVRCFETGEYQRVRRGSLVPRLDLQAVLNGPSTPKKLFSGSANVALLRREGKAAKVRLSPSHNANLH